MKLRYLPMIIFCIPASFYAFDCPSVTVVQLEEELLSNINDSIVRIKKELADLESFISNPLCGLGYFERTIAALGKVQAHAALADLEKKKFEIISNQIVRAAITGTPQCP